MSRAVALSQAIEAAVRGVLFEGRRDAESEEFIQRADVAGGIRDFAARVVAFAARRLPVYLLIDTSGSMRGEPIEALKVGLEALVSGLRQDPHAVETVSISVISFDREVKVLVPLTRLASFEVPDIVAPESGPTHLGQALEVLCRCVDAEVHVGTGDRGDWRPILFILTDGSPSDIQKYREMIPEVRKRPFARILGCTLGPKARGQELQALADTVVHHDTMDSASFRQFFQWVDGAVSSGSTGGDSDIPPPLPPPPPERQTVL